MSAIKEVRAFGAAPRAPRSARSSRTVKPGARLVTIAADCEATTEQRVKDAFFIVEPNQRQLLEVAKLLDAGTLKAFVSAVVPLEEASRPAAAVSGTSAPTGRS